MNKNEYKDMIEEIRMKELLSKSDLSKSIGITYPTYYSFLKNPEKTSLKVRRKIKIFIEKYKDKEK